MTLGLAATLGFMTGCGETRDYPASGQACVVGIPFILGIIVGWEVSVDFETCVVPCGGRVVPKCEVIVEDDVITIDAWVETAGDSPICGGSCVQPVATCEWPEDLHGEYTVVYGENVRQVRLDRDDQLFCIDAGWSG